jgi:hypothetical protein
MNYRTYCPFGPQKSTHSLPFFFGACDKRSGHIDATSGERQVDIEG